MSSRPSPILTSAQNRFLRGQAHGRKALLQVGGKGVTPALVAELQARPGVQSATAFGSRLHVAGKDAALLQRIGHTAVLYRPSTEHRQIVLPRP